MDRPVSFFPGVMPGDLPRVSLLAVAVIALALLATVFIGVPDVAAPVFDVGVDPAGVLAPPF